MTVCPRCALPLSGELVAELREIDAALVRLDAERGRLLGRRAQLLWQLRPVPAARVAPGASAGPGPVAGREASPRAAQNLLLSLGGVLLTVAAIAFTVVSWGSLGIGGRAVVLGALTAAVLAVPVLLVRRRLNATAEVVACLGLVLLLLDAYAVRRVALADTDGLRYAAVAIALISALWTVYGRLAPTRRLVLPGPAALLLAQLPLPLLASASGSVYGLGAALLGTAALDAVVADRAGRNGLRVTAAVAGAVSGVCGLLMALALSVDSGGFGGAAGASGLLLAGAGVALAAGLRSPGWAAPGLSAVAGLAGITALGGMVRVAVAQDWAVPGYLLCAVGVLAAVAALHVRGVLPRAVATGLGIGAAVVHGLALLWALPALVVGVFGPLSLLDSAWSGASAGGWTGPASAVAVPAVLAGVLAALRLRSPARCGALVFAAVTATVLPSALDLPYPVAVLLRVTVVAVLLIAARTVADRVVVRTALGSAGVLAATAVAWGLADRSLTLVVLAVLLVAFAGTAATRNAPEARAVGGAAGVACAAGLAWAAPLAAGWPAHGAAFVVLAVAVAAVGAARWAQTPDAVGPVGAARRARTRDTGDAKGTAQGAPAPDTADAVSAARQALTPDTADAAGTAQPARTPGRAVPGDGAALTLALEFAGYATAALAIALAAGDAAVLALVLAVAGVLAGAVALRADRRPAAGYAAAALMVAASWVRLAASDVAVPEAYTLPVSVAALAVGFLRRHRDAAASSWAAYAPGLAATLLPSLLAAWADPHWLRPLLLGSGALAVALLGARHRLQAPLLLGGAVLALDALHELAPLVVQAIGALPRWLPLALAGVLLLTVGATYERRLRDVRRVRDLLGRLR